MVVRNSNGADVDLDLAPAATRLQLNLLGTGANVTTGVHDRAAGGTRGWRRDPLERRDRLARLQCHAGRRHAGNVIVSGFVGGIDVDIVAAGVGQHGRRRVGELRAADGGRAEHLEDHAATADRDRGTDRRGRRLHRSRWRCATTVRPRSTSIWSRRPTRRSDFGGAPGWVTNLQAVARGRRFHALRRRNGHRRVQRHDHRYQPRLTQLIYGRVDGIEINRNVARFR